MGGGLLSVSSDSLNYFKRFTITTPMYNRYLRLTALLGLFLVFSFSGTALLDYVDRGNAEEILTVSVDEGTVLHEQVKIAETPFTADLVSTWDNKSLDADRKASSTDIWTNTSNTTMVLSNQGSLDVSGLSQGTYAVFLWGCDRSDGPESCGWLKPRLFTVPTADTGEGTDTSFEDDTETTGETESSQSSSDETETLCEDPKANIRTSDVIREYESTSFRAPVNDCNAEIDSYSWTFTMDGDTVAEASSPSVSQSFGNGTYTASVDIEASNGVESSASKGFYVSQTIPGDLILSGHRGGYHAPENTLMTFERSREVGINSVEFDVRKASEGYVVIHDKTTGRTAGEDKSVPDTDLETLTGMNVGEDYYQNDDWDIPVDRAEEATIPGFEETLDYFKRTDMMLRIELKGKVKKSEEMGRELYEITEEKGMEDQVIFMSFSGTCLPDPRSTTSRICEWEALKGIEEASNGDAETAILWQKRKDPRKDVMNAANLDIRHALNRAEAQNFDIIVARDDVNGIEHTTMTRKNFVDEVEEKGLEFSFMGFRGSREEEAACGVEWLSTNNPENLIDKVQKFHESSYYGNSECAVENPTDLTTVPATFGNGLKGLGEFVQKDIAGEPGEFGVDIFRDPVGTLQEGSSGFFEWGGKMSTETISGYKRLRKDPVGTLGDTYDSTTDELWETGGDIRNGLEDTGSDIQDGIEETGSDIQDGYCDNIGFGC